MRKELLTDKQLLFCNEYLKDFNGSRAYKEIYKGATDNTARTEASKLLAKPNIAEYIAEQKQKLMNKQEVTVERVVEKLRFIAEAGTKTQLVETKNGVKEKYTDLTNANSALEKLGKYLKMYTDRIEADGNVNVNVISYKKEE